MSRNRIVLTGLGVLLAVVLGVGARDLSGWDAALARTQAYDARLPGDPVGSALAARDALEYRASLRAFRAALRTKRGFDGGESRGRARSAAQALLAEVATTAPARRASQAQNLIGILALSGGSSARGESALDQARSSFEAAIRADPTGSDAKYNLELLLRRERPTGTRAGPQSGSGPRGRSERGAGSGTPGRGY